MTNPARDFIEKELLPWIGNNIAAFTLTDPVRVALYEDLKTFINYDRHKWDKPESWAECKKDYDDAVAQYEKRSKEYRLRQSEGLCK
jgi:hypothetical protein